MKLVFALVLTFITLSSAFAESIVHTIEAGRLHQGGTLTITIISERQTDFDAEIQYKVIPKPLVPMPANYRQGSFIATFPIEFLDERGYEDLQTSAQTHNGAKLLHLGKKDLPGFRDSHHVKLIPESNKWTLEAWYHPSVRSTGWAKLKLEFKNTFLGAYQVFSNLN